MLIASVFEVASAKPVNFLLFNDNPSVVGVNSTCLVSPSFNVIFLNVGSSLKPTKTCVPSPVVFTNVSTFSVVYLPFLGLLFSFTLHASDVITLFASFFLPVISNFLPKACSTPLALLSATTLNGFFTCPYATASVSFVPLDKPLIFLLFNVKLSVVGVNSTCLVSPSFNVIFLNVGSSLKPTKTFVPSSDELTNVSTFSVVYLPFLGLLFPVTLHASDEIALFVTFLPVISIFLPNA